MLKTKSIAFLIHAGLSLIPISLITAVIFYAWYPHVLFYIDGGWQGARILILVDVVLGPLLTFIVYNPKKPELIRDLSIIVSIQITCLAGGVHIIYDERPLAVVFSNNEFHTINNSAYEYFEIDPTFLDKMTGDHPKYLFAHSEQKPEKKDLSKLLETLNIVPERFRRELLSDLSQHTKTLDTLGLNDLQLSAEIPDQKNKIEAIWNTRKSVKSKFYKLTGRYHSVYALFDPILMRFESEHISP